uniref:Uncharacterized protein n=1 Tax=Anguilla anguilla TaxID=7936 RepID=A0A0E9XU00_ANGAN
MWIWELEVRVDVDARPLVLVCHFDILLVLFSVLQEMGFWLLVGSHFRGHMTKAGI